MDELGLGEREVTVVLVDDPAIRELNRAHRDVDEATDVLSYPTSEPDDDGFPEIPHLGDVIISLDTAARQAPDHDHDLMQEVMVLAAHGLVHLMGYDHDTEEAWQIFTKAETRVLTLANA
jgi:probable rRNA maturation factor